jgi:hypothetical protein
VIANARIRLYASLLGPPVAAYKLDPIASDSKVRINPPVAAIRDLRLPHLGEAPQVEFPLDWKPLYA